MKELRPEDFRNFVRMDVSCFDKLLSLIYNDIHASDTVMREAISPSRRLVVTLRFLATGESFKSLSFSHRISQPSISRIVVDVCNAICNKLKDKYLKALSAYSSDEILSGDQPSGGVVLAQRCNEFRTHHPQFLEDPLNIEDPSLCVKQELKLDVEGSEQKFLQDPLSIVEPGHHIKEDPELKLDVDGSEHTFLQDPLSFEEPGHHIKQETKMKLDVDDSEHNFLQDPLNIDELGHHIKQDPDLKRNVDGFDHHVVASTSYASNSTRLIQNTEESCDFSFEETVDEGVVHSELEMRADESTHFSMYGGGGEEGQREEEELEEEGPKCSLQQNKCLRFGCSICLQSFPSKYSLIMHVFVHIDGVQPPMYVCKSCGEVFPSRISMCKHLSMSKVEQSLAACNNEKFDCSDDHKSIYLESDWEDNAMVEPQNRYSSKEPCKSSKKSFNVICKSHSVIKDAEIPHSSDYYKTLLTTNKVNDRPIVSSVNRPHKCNVCEKSCSSLADLKRHLLIHTGNKPYKCDICDKSFIHKRSVKVHALIHSDKRPYKCDTCGKSFYRKNDLKYHALIHSGIRPYKCDICGKYFSRKSHLNHHVLKHSERRIYKCEVCAKYLVSMDGLKNHALMHTEDRPHECNICKKSFISLRSLKKHVLIHT